jgi:hypothetical protein
LNPVSSNLIAPLSGTPGLPFVEQQFGYRESGAADQQHHS